MEDRIIVVFCPVLLVATLDVVARQSVAAGFATFQYPVILVVAAPEPRSSLLALEGSGFAAQLLDFAPV